MKKVFNIFIALIFILILGSCNESDEKIVPIFEGLSLINNDNIKKVTNKNLNVREETDYSELIPIDIVNSNVTYFTKAGSEVRIAVNLYNPSQFEIMSLTINDLKYQSYQFEDGSNSDILYIDVLAPNNPGEYEYNIDEIKYVDGKDIKDVNMENGNKQIKFGVTYEKLPIVNISNQNITNNSINLDIQVSDNLNVLNAGNGLNAYLFNEDNMIIASTKLENSKIMFNNLKEGTYYTYVLATSVDMLDGMGAGTYILLQEKFRTTSTIDFKDIVATKNEISYDVIIKNENSYINSINLIDGEKIVDITNTRIIKDLLSDHNYILELNYKYGDYEYKIREDVKTLENVKPIIKAFNAETNKNSINYNYNY